MDIIYTPGGASDNSYVTLADAQTYYEEMLLLEWWMALSKGEQQDALIRATRMIEDLQEEFPAGFVGAPRTSTQRLHFPRSGDYNTTTSAVFIIRRIQIAVLQQAFWAHGRDADGPPMIDRAQLREEGVTTISIEGFQEAYTPSRDIRPPDIAPKAWKSLRRLIRWGKPIAP